MNGPYKIGTLSKLTGFSPALLRAWEKRFGLITPERGDGRQRVYGDDDLAILRRVRALVDQGRTIGEIARHGRGHLLTDSAPVASPPGAGSDGTAEFRKRIINGALALNARDVGTALDEAFATLGSDGAVADVIVPAAVRIGELWEAGRCSVASEHMASSRFLHRIGRLVDAAQPVNEFAPRVVAACFPDEHHQLGLLVLAWHLARHGMRVEYLGAATPIADLARACRPSPPRALVLSVMRKQLFRRHREEVLRWSRDLPSRVYVGGQGVAEHQSTPSDRVAFMPGWDIQDAVRRIVSDLTQAPPPARPASSRSRR